MKNRVDVHRREVEFQVGEKVFLKLRPYRQQTLARRANEKLAARFYGPYEITARKAVGEGLIPVSIPPHLTVDGVLEAQPEEVLDGRVNPMSGQREVFIKWVGLPESDCTWEGAAAMAKPFHRFQSSIDSSRSHTNNNTSDTITKQNTSEIDAKEAVDSFTLYTDDRMILRAYCYQIQTRIIMKVIIPEVESIPVTE
ncbi:PREDICTED: uncharacterized protein LOC106314550 [Brassica oleracea var. oleracea]|uniref:uncharacterized protein LOC106314550 n=1 Tax=Brassica oleracea var. oleracea TaxID=109376 RepID=UPI0006A6BBB2|nr:PREDICTED: uncharacterized protein LOC106314550 [Brassica oleracea var. oleracea]